MFSMRCEVCVRRIIAIELHTHADILSTRINSFRVASPEPLGTSLRAHDGRYSLSAATTIQYSALAKCEEYPVLYHLFIL